MNWNFVYVPLMAITFAVIQIVFSHTPVVETLLQYLLFISVGFSNIVAFYLHGFRGDKLAENIGWPKGSPFQWEIAGTSLAMGILGIMSYWIKGDFWLATIIGFSVFMLVAAAGHIREIIVNKNYAHGNAGLVLYYDIIMPIILIVLYIIYAVY